MTIKVSGAFGASILFSGIVMASSFSPNCNTQITLRFTTTCFRDRGGCARTCLRISEDVDFTKLEADRMDSILELQRQTSYMNRFTTSSYLNKIQYDMAVNMKKNSRVIEEKKPVKWPIFASIEQKIKKLAGNALDLIFASIFYMSGESKAAADQRGRSAWLQKAADASHTIRSKLLLFVVSLKSIGKIFHGPKSCKSDPPGHSSGGTKPA